MTEVKIDPLFVQGVICIVNKALDNLALGICFSREGEIEYVSYLAAGSNDI